MLQVDTHYQKTLQLDIYTSERRLQTVTQNQQDITSSYTPSGEGSIVTHRQKYVTTRYTPSERCYK